MKFNKLALAVGVAVLGMSAVAQAELSANVGVTTNYLWRGVTQTDEGPALSGGLDYANDNGFYAGTWASNVDFLDSNKMELDLYAGFGGEAGEVAYDLGVIYYAYPIADTGDDKLDFTEIYASLSFGPVTAGVNYNIDKEDGTAETGDLYSYLSASTEVSGVGIGGTFGHQNFDGAGNGSYNHMQFDVSKSVEGVGDFTFTVSKANDSGAGVNEDTQFALSWGTSFDL